MPLRGQPIIDIQASLDESRCAAAIAELEALGYSHHGQGGVPGREYLTRRPSHGPPMNVHPFASDSSLLADNRMIRDYLRAHPRAANEYAAIKERAVAQGQTDLLTYSHAKAEGLAAIREDAYRWTQRQRA